MITQITSAVANSELNQLRNNSTANRPIEENRYKKVEQAKSDKENLKDVHETMGLNKIKASEWLNLGNSIAIGIVGSALLRACKPIPGDVMVAGASAVAYISAEVYSSIKKTDMLERIEVDYKKAKDENDGQYASLVALRNAYEINEKINNTKKQIQMAAAAGLTAAAGWAFLKSTQEKISAKSCIGAFETALTTLSASDALCASATIGAPECLRDVNSCKIALGAGLNKFLESQTMWESSLWPSAKKAYKLTSDIPQIEGATKGCLTVTAPVAAPIEATCGMHFTVLENDKAACHQRGLMLTVENKQIFKIIDEFIDLKINGDPVFSRLSEIKKNETKNIIWRIFSGINTVLFEEAHAWDLKATLGLGAVGAGILFGLIPGQAGVIDQFLATPTHRAMAFGTMAASIGYASITSATIAKQMGQNKNEVDRIIKNYNDKKLATQSGKNERNRTEQNIANLHHPISTSDSSNEEKLSEPLPCMTGETNGKCNQIGSYNETDKKFLENISASNLMSAPINLANSLTGANSLSAGTLNLANGLASKNAVSLRFLKKSRGRYLDELKKGSKGELDKFVKTENENRDLIIGQAEKIMAEKNIDKSTFYAAMGHNADLLKNGEASKSDIQKEIEKEFSQATKGSQIQATPEANFANTNVFDFKLDEDAGDEINLEHDGAFSISGLDKGTVLSPIDAGDLNKQVAPDDGYSIFDKISKRYIKSAYPRFFTEIKDPKKN